MANNPIDTGGYTHFLNFVSLGFSSLYEITEPPGFNVANLLIKQNDARFSRDIFYANDNANETYYFANGFEIRETEQVINPNGKTSKHLDMGLAWILETRKRFGSRGVIERILKKDGITFTIGILDVGNADTDGFSYFGCNIIQNTKTSIYKKNIETTINILSTRNINNEPITPAPTLKVLRKSVPITKNSEWGKTVQTNLINFSSAVFFAFNNKVLTSNISNTLSSIADAARYNDAYPGTGWRYYTMADNEAGGFVFTEGANGGSMQLLKSKKKLTNVKVRVRFKGSITKRETGFGDMTFNYIIMANYGDFKGNFDAGNYISAFSIPLTLDVAVPVDITTVVDLPFDLSIDEILYGCYTCLQPAAPYFATPCYLTIEESHIEVIGSELALDSVISAVRYIDVVKQCAKFLGELPVNAPMFDVDGDYYNNVCYNRALLSMESNNTLTLVTTSNPEGQNIGDVVYNDVDNGTMQIGLHFWNGSIWIKLDESQIDDIALTSSSVPAGTVIGELRQNTEREVTPFGLCFWNGDNWQSLEYSQPFITTAKACMEESLTFETCCDSAIKEDEIYYGRYQDFYNKNIEVAELLEIPSKDFKEIFNEKFKINNAKFNFEVFEQNRLAKNNSEDIHTEAEWNIPNEYVENKFERTIRYARSGYASQTMIDLDNNSPLTAYENDEKVFVDSIVDLPADSFNEFPASLFMQIIGSNLQVYNTTFEGDQSASTINWKKLGLSNNFEIVSGPNSGNYTIVSFTSSILLLAPVGFTPSYTGDATVTVKFIYENVLYQTETNQRITVISGLNNPDSYPNLFYSLRRIFGRWSSYFNSACIGSTIDVIKNLKFTNNPRLKSQLFSEDPIYEKDDIKISDLEEPILTENEFETEIYISFAKALYVLERMALYNGFIRTYHISGRIIKGFIKDFDYTWKTGRLKMIIEEMYEPSFLTITSEDDLIVVNNVEYETEADLQWWDVTGEYFQCFDADSKPINNEIHFSKVKLNGLTYDNVDDLVDALLSL